jgi:hypothetical protein
MLHEFLFSVRPEVAVHLQLGGGAHTGQPQKVL